MENISFIGRTTARHSDVTTNITNVTSSLTREYMLTDEARHACITYDFVIEAVLMGALCVFGFAGNSLSILCLRRDRSKTATPLILITLEVADTVSVTSSIR